jgi:hypothetical protein
MGQDCLRCGKTPVKPVCAYCRLIIKGESASAASWVKLNDLLRIEP